MLELYPRESICDVVWQLFALPVQDVCCEVFVHAICKVCSRAVVCAVYAWLGMALLFVGGCSPVWTGDTWMGPYMTNRCVEMCMRFVSIGHCCSHHRLEVRILCN